MHWNLITQTEKYGKMEVPVICKKLKFFPMEANGETVFARLKKPVFQVLVSYNKDVDNPVKLKWNGVSFLIQYPIRKDETKAEKEEFGSLASFKRHCVGRFGEEMTETILSHFKVRCPESHGIKTKETVKS